MTQSLNGSVQKVQTMIIRSEAALSCISDIPQFFYHKPSGVHIVFWFGLAMTRSQALMIVAEKYEISYLNKAMKHSAFEDFKRAYLLKAFGNVDWSRTLNSISPDNHFNKLRDKVNKCAENFGKDNAFNRCTITQAMQWFDVDNENILET